MSRQRMESRITTLETHQVGAFPRELVTELARQFDLSEAEILAEADDLTDQYRQRGLVTTDQIMAYVADDLGISVEELQAEIDGMLSVGR